MARFLKLLFVSLVALSASAVSAVELLNTEKSHSRFDIRLETLGFEPGATQWLAVTYTPRKEWHTYWKNYGDSGAPPYLIWSTPTGVSVGEPLFPTPEPIAVGPLMNYGYHEANTLLVPIKVASDFNKEVLHLELTAEWLVCKIPCIPQTGMWQLEIELNSALDPAEKEFFSESREQIPEPSFWQAELSIANEIAELSVFASPEDFDAPIAKAYFFPEQEGVLTYSASQQWAWDDNGLNISFTRDAGTPKPDTVQGVFVVTGEDGKKHAYNLVPALVQTTTPENEPRSTAGIKTITPTGNQLPVWQALVFALLGGIILNLMPCVFPVLSLKAMALAGAQYKDSAERKAEGWAYTLGIWFSFMVIVAILVALRQGGAALGWGFQLQNPLFIAGLSILMLIVSLSLFGLFEIQTGFEGAGDGLTKGQGTKPAFFKGVLATLVATPCTAPLMAPAIGFALTQPLLVIILVFSCLAFGLALPFLLLSYSEKAASLMPKPGPWMDTFKQLLAFPMLLTACWLVYVYNMQAGTTATFVLLVALTLVAFGCWLWQKSQHIMLRLVAIAAFVGASVSIYQTAVTEPASQTNAKTELAAGIFSEPKLAKILAENKATFVYFTADWCITCKVNEKLVLNTADIQSAFADNNVTVLKADWTNRNDEIANILARYGRAGVPMYLYYPKGQKEAVVLPEILTKTIILEAIAAS